MGGLGATKISRKQEEIKQKIMQAVDPEDMERLKHYARKVLNGYVKFGWDREDGLEAIVRELKRELRGVERRRNY